MNLRCVHLEHMPEFGRVTVTAPDYRGRPLEETWVLCAYCLGLAMGSMTRPFKQDDGVVRPARTAVPKRVLDDEEQT